MKKGNDIPGNRRSSLGSRLREARRYAALTQQSAGEKIGVDPNTIARYEAGRITPSSTALFALAQIYKRSVEWFYAEEEQGQTKPDDDTERWAIEADRELVMNEASLALRSTGKELSDEAIRSIADFIRFVHEKERRESQSGS